MNTRTPLPHTAVPRRASRHALSRFSRPLATLGGSLALCAASSAYAAPFGAGDIVVSRISTSAPSGSATAIFLDEYTISGAFVQTIALPTATTGNNRQITISNSASSEGFLKRSTNGAYLTIGGYDASVGTTGISSTASATVNRVIARIGANGVADTSTALTDAYSANSFRSVMSVDGTQFYTGGNGSNVAGVATGGVRLATLGATSSTSISSTPVNDRVVSIFNNQLYVSSGSSPNIGVNSVGTGLPTTTGQTTTLIAPDAVGSTPSPYDFVFSTDGLTAFVADDRTNTSGGLLRFTRTDTSSNFTLTNTFNIAGATTTSSGLRGLTGNANVGTLFATTTDNRLISISGLNLADNTSTVTVLASATTGTAFRGVDFAPQVAAVPEPGLMLGFSMGAGLLGMVRLRSRKRLA